MNRRGFIKRAAAVIVSLAVARELPKEEPELIGVDMALEGSEIHAHTIRNGETITATEVKSRHEKYIKEMSQEMSNSLFYGSDPETFTGIAARYKL